MRHYHKLFWPFDLYCKPSKIQLKGKKQNNLKLFQYNIYPRTEYVFGQVCKVHVIEVSNPF